MGQGDLGEGRGGAAKWGVDEAFLQANVNTSVGIITSYGGFAWCHFKVY